MSTTTRRLIGAAAVPALAFGLAACTSDDSGSDGDDAAAQRGAHEMVLAAYEDLDGSSYTMESTVTVNDLDLMNMSTVVDGESTHSTQDISMSAIIDAMGEDYSEDPEMAEMMESMFADMHTEAILVDKVIYMQFAGGMFDAMSEDFGEDAWFTLDLAEDSHLGDIYRQFGSFDLAEQTELMLTDLADVEETGDGVYTGTLSPDSEAMQSLLGATGGMANGVEIPEDIEVTITLDDDDLLKTIEMTLPETEGMVIDMVSEVTEIGGDYAIAAPESDNLHSFEEFAGAMQ
ncbi:hypothetical protein [Glycomyces arizonensis]|uniref:hypothetical protein n=1 Tax=Glycomyces arizonensis TaxID=256035 RepID=UPI000409EA18|nr:hypothetical protein [Glycomyces arizonensis]